MANEKIIAEKAAQVDAIKEDIKNASSIVFVDYKGITVEQDTVLRKNFREAGVKYTVLKNRLVKRAFNELDVHDFDEFLEGTNAFAFGMEDETAPARVAKEAEDKKLVKIQCGRLGNDFLNAEGVQAIAKIPSKDVLIAQFMGLLKEPVAAFARVLSAIAEKQN